MNLNINGVKFTLTDLLNTNNNLSFLIGAGCSYDYPSNLETGLTIMKSLIKLSCVKSEINPILQLIDNGKLRFEMLIEIFRNNIDPTMKFIKYFDQCQKPNDQHYFIVQMLKNCNYIMTVNFDNLIEIALLNSGVPKQNIIPVIEKPDFLRYYNPRDLLKESSYPIYKIHGSTRNIISNKDTLDSLITTIHALGKGKSKHTIFSVEPFKSFAFKNILANRILIIMGYSGSDDFDIIPSIKKIHNIRAILWFNHMNQKMTPTISEVRIKEKSISKVDLLNGILTDLKLAHKKIPIFRIDINLSKFLSTFINKEKVHTKHINFLQMWLGNKFKMTEFYKKIYFTYQIYVNLNIFQKSIDMAEKLLLHSLELKDIEINIYALAMLAIDYFTIGSVVKSKFYTKKTLSLMEEFNYKKPLKAMVLSNFGIIYRKMGDNTEAKKLFQKALEISIDLNDEESSATYMSNLADVLIENKEFLTAKNWLRKAIRIDRKLGSLDSMSYHLSNMAHLYSEQNLNSKAIDILYKSLYIEKGMKDARGIIQRINNIGNVYFKQGNFIKARYWYRKVLFLLSKNNYPEENYECYNNLGAVFLELYDFNKGLCYHQLALDQLKKIGRGDSNEFERIKNLIEDIKKDPLYVP